MVAFSRAVVVLISVLLALIPTLNASTADNEWIVDKAIPSLIRFNAKGQIISGDLSDYIKFKCKGKGKGKTCEIDQENMKLSNIEELYQPSDDGTIQSYGTGVALYAFISIAAGLLVILLTILYLLNRLICGSFYYCIMGSDKNKKSWFNSKMRTTANLLLIAVFFAFLAVMLILCYSLGVQNAFDSTSDAVDAPYGVAQIAYHFSLATQPLFIGLVSTVVLPTLRNVNSTISGVINWEGIINDLKDIDDIVDSLPDLRKIKGSINTIDSNITSLNQSFHVILDYGYNYQELKLEVVNATRDIQDDLRAVNSSLVELNNLMDSIEDSVNIVATDYELLFGADGPENYTPSDRDGYIDYVQYDIARLARDDTPGEGVPTIATLDDASRGATASMQRFLNGNLNGQSSELLALNAKLHNIYESVVQLPNFADTATVLEQINDLIQDMVEPGGVIAVMPGQLQSIETAMNNLPDTDVIADHLTVLYDLLDSLESDGLVTQIRRSEDLVSSISDELGYILDEVVKIIDAAENIRAPLYDLMIVQPQGFNRTIMENPYDLVYLFDTVNETLSDAIESANEVLPDIHKVHDSLEDDIDIDGFIDTIEDIQGQIDEVVLTVNKTALLNALDSANIDSYMFNATDYIYLVNGVNETLSQSTVSSEFISKLRYLEDLRAQLEASLHTLVAQVGDTKSDGSTVTREGDYWRLAKGVCSDDTTVYCEANTDCGGTCSSIAVYRCSPNGDGTYPVTPCTLDSHCNAATSAGTVTSRCLADYSRALALQVGLDALADPSTTQLDQDSVDDAFSALRDAAVLLDVDGLLASIDEVQENIDLANTWTYEQALADLVDQLQANDDDIMDIFDTIEDATDEIGDIDFDDFTSELDDVQDKIDEYGDKLTEYIGFAEDLQTYMFHTDGLKARFKDLNKENMEAVLETEGFGPVLMYTGQTIEGAIDDVLALMANNSFREDRIEVTNDMREPAMYMDRATANEKAGFFDLYTVGSLYYLMQMSNDTAEMMVNAHDPSQYLILTDRDGNTYPDSKVCVTRYCFENQQEELEEDYGQYLPLLLVLPAIIALLALANFFCLFTTAKYTCSRQCCSKTLLCWIIAVVPWYLIFSGILFAFMIGVSDTCTAGPYIGQNYVTAMGDDLCIKLDGVGNLTECHIRGNDFDVAMDLRRMSNVLLGLEQCTGDLEEDPYYAPLHALATQLRSSTRNRTREEVYKHKYRKYRRPVKDLVLDFTDGAAEVTHDFVDALGSEVLTCDNVGAVVEYFTSPVCYSTVGPMTWIFATLYLAAWAMCCVGIPAGCALKNHYKWSYYERKKQQEAEAAESKSRGFSKQNLMLYHMLAMRGRGPLASRSHYQQTAGMTENPAAGGDGGDLGAAWSVGAAAVDGSGAEQDEIAGYPTYSGADEEEAAYQHVLPPQAADNTDSPEPPRPAGGGYFKVYPKRAGENQHSESQRIAEKEAMYGAGAFSKTISKEEEGKDSEGGGDSESEGSESVHLGGETSEGLQPESFREDDSEDRS